MSAFNVHCNVCLTDLPLENIRVLQCGHTLCVDCLTTLKEVCSLLTCPTCRRRIITRAGRDRLPDGQQLFVTIIPVDDDKDLLAHTDVVVKELNSMEEDSDIEDVERAERNVQSVKARMDIESECANRIFDSVNCFKNRIMPLFKAVKSLKAKYDAACADVEQLREEIQISLKKTAIVQSEFAKAKVTLEKAITIGEDAKAHVVHLRRENEKLQTRVTTAVEEVERVNTVEKDLMKENHRLKSILGSHKQAALNERERRKVIEMELKHLKSASASGSRLPTPRTNPIGISLNEPDPVTFSSRTSTDSPHSDTSCLLPAPHSQHWAVPPTRVPSPELDIAGLPNPRFVSDWSLASIVTNQKKRKLDMTAGKLRLPAPLNLDSHGKPKGTIQLGSRRKLQYS